MQLDPALVEAGRRPPTEAPETPLQNRVNGGTSEQELPSGKAERRAQLMREAEVMRAALRAKEREIDDLT
jgi:hypothetical protein